MPISIVQGTVGYHSKKDIPTPFCYGAQFWFGWRARVDITQTLTKISERDKNISAIERIKQDDYINRVLRDEGLYWVVKKGFSKIMKNRLVG